MQAGRATVGGECWLQLQRGWGLALPRPVPRPGTRHRGTTANGARCPGQCPRGPRDTNWKLDCHIAGNTGSCRPAWPSWNAAAGLIGTLIAQSLAPLQPRDIAITCPRPNLWRPNWPIYMIFILLFYYSSILRPGPARRYVNKTHLSASLILGGPMNKQNTFLLLFEYYAN